ncbi:MAG TPA: AAA family ATPase, partial [Thermomicrobiales bacterium]|nr:AAA family ATPase [Thermomicrobiales bacterium]
MSTVTHQAAALPHQLTPLIGRRNEIERLVALITAKSDRLITLTGPGGVGKTRLAIEVADQAWATAFDHVWYVPLAHITDSDRVIATIAGALELGNRDHEEAPITTLIRAIGNQRVLLVLDNLEQLLAVGPTLVELLHSLPGLTIVATSQVRLRLAGEHEFALPPMFVPSVEELTTLPIDDLPDAIALFVDRAQAIGSPLVIGQSNVATVAAICRAVDGIPLAIELAAARTRMLSLDDLLARLDRQLALLTGGPRDLPERQKTMRNAIAWSYGLLSPTEQRFLRALSVFSGGFSLATADPLVPDGEDALDLLGSLVDKSLVYREADARAGTRYNLFASIREFGQEQPAAVADLDEAA